MAELEVRVQPRASRSRIEVTEGGIKVWVTATPTDGQANAAVCELMAKALGVAKTRVAVIRGFTSRAKLLEVEGLDADGIRERLAQLPQ